MMTRADRVRVLLKARGKAEAEVAAILREHLDEVGEAEWLVWCEKEFGSESAAYNHLNPERLEKDRARAKARRANVGPSDVEPDDESKSAETRQVEPDDEPKPVPVPGSPAWKKLGALLKEQDDLEARLYEYMDCIEIDSHARTLLHFISRVESQIDDLAGDVPVREGHEYDDYTKFLDGARGQS